MKCRSCGSESRIVQMKTGFEVHKPHQPYRAPRLVPLPEGQIVRVRVCTNPNCQVRWRTVECRESEASFVEAFKYVKSRRRAPA